MNVRVGAWGRLSAKELTLLNYSARENSWVPCIAMRSDKSVLKKSNLEYSLEGLMLKLKLKFQHLDYLMWRATSLEKTLILGKIEGRRRKGWQRMRLLDGYHWLSGHELSTLQEAVKGGEEVQHVAVHGVAKSWIQHSNWTSKLTL